MSSVYLVLIWNLITIIPQKPILKFLNGVPNNKNKHTKIKISIQAQAKESVFFFKYDIEISAIYTSK